MCTRILDHKCASRAIRVDEDERLTCSSARFYGGKMTASSPKVRGQPCQVPLTCSLFLNRSRSTVRDGTITRWCVLSDLAYESDTHAPCPWRSRSPEQVTVLPQCAIRLLSREKGCADHCASPSLPALAEAQRLDRPPQEQLAHRQPPRVEAEEPTRQADLLPPGPLRRLEEGQEQRRAELQRATLVQRGDRRQILLRGCVNCL